MKRVGAVAATDRAAQISNQFQLRKNMSDQDHRTAEAVAAIRRHPREESVFPFGEFSGRIEHKKPIKTEEPRTHVLRKGDIHFHYYFSLGVDPVNATYDREDIPDFSADTFRIGGPVKESFLLNDAYFKDLLPEVAPPQFEQESEEISAQYGSGTVFDFFEE